MKTANITLPLYELSELTERAREKAIQHQREFLLEIMCPNDFISGDPEFDTPEQLQRQYEDEFEYYAWNDEPIIESIEANEYLFYADGSMAHVVEYVAGPLKGKTILKIHGTEFAI